MAVWCIAVHLCAIAADRIQSAWIRILNKTRVYKKPVSPLDSLGDAGVEVLPAGRCNITTPGCESLRNHLPWELQDEAGQKYAVFTRLAKESAGSPFLRKGTIETCTLTRESDAIFVEASPMEETRFCTGPADVSKGASVIWVALKKPWAAEGDF